MGARTGIRWGPPPALRVCAAGSATSCRGRGGPAANGRRDTAARMVTPVAGTPTATSAAATHLAAPVGARVPIALAVTATRAAEGARTITATATAIASAPRAGAGAGGHTGTADGMEAGPRRRGVDSGRYSRQQLDLARRGERLVRRLRRQAARCGARFGTFAGSAGFGTFAGSADYVLSARRADSRTSLRTAGGRRSGTAAGAAHLGHRTRRHPAAPGAGAPATLATAAAQAATPQRRRHRDHRWTVGR
jgi:hypothetical protein